MIKFVHKKHISKARSGNKAVVYYSVSDIVLGVVLWALVAFFVISYLNVNLHPKQTGYINYKSHK